MLLQQRVSTCVGHLQLTSSVRIFEVLYTIFTLVLLSYLLCYWRLFLERFLVPL